jgi:site-specific recombinase XerC
MVCDTRFDAARGAARSLELYLRWLQEVRRLKPSTVSRRLSVLATFYRTCVIDGVLEHSPAEYVRRPHVPPRSPTLGLSHLQFEAMLTAERDSANPNDFGLVAMLGLLGLRIFEATGADIAALGEARGHRVLKVHGKGEETALVPLPPAVGRAVDRAVESRIAGPILRNRAGRRRDRHAATRRLRHLAAAAGVCTGRMHPHMLRDHHARRRRRSSRRSDRRAPRRPANHHALRPSSRQPRPPPQLHPRGIPGLGNLTTAHAEMRACLAVSSAHRRGRSQPVARRGQMSLAATPDFR